MVPDWVRKLGKYVPDYGNFGGYNNYCKTDICPMPIDWLDAACARHDMDLDMGDKEADARLAKTVRDGDPKLLGWWGKTYRHGIMLIFRDKR